MAALYERIENLCRARGVNVTQMCREAGVARGNLTDLKMGRQTGLSTANLEKLARYFGVTMDELMGAAPRDGEEAELAEYLEMLRSRPECRMLFSLTRSATKEDVEKAVAIIEALRRTEER